MKSGLFPPYGSWGQAIAGPAGLFYGVIRTFPGPGFLCGASPVGLSPFWSLSHGCPSLHNSFTQRNFIYLFLNSFLSGVQGFLPYPPNTNKARELEPPTPPPLLFSASCQANDCRNSPEGTSLELKAVFTRFSCSVNVPGPREDSSEGRSRGKGHLLSLTHMRPCS